MEDLNINLTMGYLQEEDEDPKIIVEEEMQQQILLVSDFIIPNHMNEHKFGQELALNLSTSDYLCKNRSSLCPIPSENFHHIS